MFLKREKQITMLFNYDFVILMFSSFIKNPIYKLQNYFYKQKTNSSLI